MSEQLRETFRVCYRRLSSRATMIWNWNFTWCHFCISTCVFRNRIIWFPVISSCSLDVLNYFFEWKSIWFFTWFNPVLIKKVIEIKRLPKLAAIRKFKRTEHNLYKAINNNFERILIQAFKHDQVFSKVIVVQLQTKYVRQNLLTN